MEAITRPPSQEQLSRRTAIRIDSFSISGVASTASCELILVGGAWGSLIRLDSSGNVDGVGRVANSPMGAHLERSGSRLLAWATTPPTVATIDVETLTSASLHLNEHPWGGRWAGPAVPIGSDNIVMAAIGAGPARIEPVPWIPAPLLQVHTGDGRSVQAIDSVANWPGLFRSWLHARVAVASTDTALLVLSLSDGSVRRYALSTRTDSLVLISESLLPRYFRAPEDTEEIWSPPWIQKGGQLRNSIHVPQVLAATIDARARLYVLRPYAVEWKHFPNRIFPTQGRWDVTETALEIYDSVGSQPRAYSIPAGTASWIRVGPDGRIFLPDGDGGLLVYDDPLEADGERACPHFPSIVDLQIADVPPVPSL